MPSPSPSPPPPPAAAAGASLASCGWTQFQLAHTSRRRGISAASECRYTSLFWYRIASSAAASSAVAPSPRIARVTSACVARTTWSKWIFGLAAPASFTATFPLLGVSRSMPSTRAPVRTSPPIASIWATAAATYACERPLTTRQTGRSTMSRRWWLIQKRTMLTTGKSSASASEQLQMAAHIGAM